MVETRRGRRQTRFEGSFSNEENNGATPKRATVSRAAPLANVSIPHFMSPTESNRRKQAKRRVGDRTPDQRPTGTSPYSATKPPTNKRANSRTLTLSQESVSPPESPCRFLSFNVTDSPTSAPPICADSELMAKSVLQLFDVGVELRGRWWALSTVLSACNRLSNFHPATALVDGSYQLKFDEQTTLDGLFHPSFSDVVSNHRNDGSKRVYIRAFADPVTKKKIYGIFADYTTQSPTIPQLFVSDPSGWIATIQTMRPSVKPFMPHKLYQLCNFWYSTEAEKLFGAREGETALEAATSIQSMLYKAMQSAEKTKALIDCLDKKTYFIDNYNGEDLEMKFDPVQVEKLANHTREKAVYLHKAITLMLELDAENESMQWGAKCQEALIAINEATGIAKATTSRTLLQWFRDFRINRTFPNPLKKEQLGISLFVNYPEVAKEMRLFGNSNLQTLTLITMQDHVLKLVDRLATEMGVTRSEFLKANGLKDICFNTIDRWMRFLGFKNDKYRKGFYTDVHERPDVVEARIDYCLKLFKVELSSAVWIQLTEERVSELKEKKRIYPMNNGIAVEKDGETKYEYHVDDIVESGNLPELFGNDFGGNYSWRLGEDDERSMIWGQDEVVSHEKQLNSMAWYGTEGQQFMRPKDLGSLIMISGIVSRESGWLPKPTREQARRINANRAGKNYVATDAAIAVLGSATKQPLTEADFDACCFRWHIHPGANNDGYWTNNHTLIQFENTADCAAVMFPDQRHYVTYDHSQGHRAKRKDGLDTSRMNKEHGGQQPEMHSTRMSHKTLGIYLNDGHRLRHGDEQCCVFREGDDGPAWLSPEQQQATRYDKIFPNQYVNRTLRTKKEMHKHLLDSIGDGDKAGIPSTSETISLASLRDIAKQKNISLSIREVKSQKGWMNAPKGALQLCIERGLVDLKIVKANRGHYTMDGRKDDNGDLIDDTSLRDLLDNCDDFRNEISMLEWIGRHYGWVVIFSPKCHPEIAGCGIEHIWSCAKNELSRIPLKQRKGKDLFTKQVLTHCFTDKVLTLQAVRGCARKSRQFLTAYLMMHAIETAKKEQQQSESGDEHGTENVPLLVGEVSLESLKNNGCALKFQTIQAARKMYKRHRGIALFNKDDDKVTFHGLEEVDEWMRRHKPTRS